jgi:hypothetical protein
LTKRLTAYEFPAGTAAPNVRLAALRVPVEPMVVTSHVLADVLAHAEDSETNVAGLLSNVAVAVAVAVLAAPPTCCADNMILSTPPVTGKLPEMVHVVPLFGMVQVVPWTT